MPGAEPATRANLPPLEQRLLGPETWVHDAQGTRTRSSTDSTLAGGRDSPPSEHDLGLARTCCGGRSLSRPTSSSVKLARALRSGPVRAGPSRSTPPFPAGTRTRLWCRAPAPTGPARACALT